MRAIAILIIVSGLFVNLPSNCQTIPANEVIQKAMNYHDPDGSWPMLDAYFTFEESRPSGEIRNTRIRIDNSQGYFRIRDNDGREYGMVLDSCYVASGDIDCERAEWIRDYYLYLWGLPMKLLDEGTVIQKEAALIHWQNIPAVEVIVDYETDRWYFYFSREFHHLVGYMFVKNDGSGEKILLSGEQMIKGLRIPSIRRWYVLETDEFLGQDKLVLAESAD